MGRRVGQSRGHNYPGFLLALLLPGAFILLGCLIAWKNWVEARAAARRPSPQPLALGDDV